VAGLASSFFSSFFSSGFLSSASFEVARVYGLVSFSSSSYSASLRTLEMLVAIIAYSAFNLANLASSLVADTSFFMAASLSSNFLVTSVMFG
jgi:hypothetical protein